jgi:hypothetical protein
LPEAIRKRALAESVLLGHVADGASGTEGTGLRQVRH